MDSHSGNFLEGGNGFDDVRGDAAHPAPMDPAELAGLIDHLPGVVYRCEATAPWRVHYVSPQAAELTGYPAADFMSGAMRWRDIVHPDDVAAGEAKRAAGITGKGGCVIEYRIVRRNGEICWVVEHSNIVRQRGGGFALEGYVYDNSAQKQTELALRAGRAQLSTVFEQALVGILHRDPAGHVISVNDTLCRMLGRSVEELEGTPLAEMFYAEDVEETVRNYEVHAATGTPYMVERRFRRPDGSTIWCEVQVHFVRDEDGKVESAISLLLDITERREVDEQRTHAMNMLQMALQGADAGLFELNVKDFSLRLSPEARRIYGLPEDHGPLLSHAAWRELLHPDDLALPPPVAADQKAQSKPAALEFRVRDRDGDIRWLRSLSHAIPTDTGDMTWLAGLVFDDTERKRAEKAARAGETLNLSITEASADGITLLDMDGRVTFMNRHALAAAGATDFAALMGKAWAECWPEAVRPTLAAAIDDARPGGVGRFTGSTHKAKGDETWWDVAITPVPGENGGPSALLAISRDVTEQRRTVERVRWAAGHDAMTGLPNRRVFHEALQDALEEARQSGTRVGLLVLDIDHFKEVNDDKGHDAGDALLRVFSERLRSAVRSTDTVARLGGDEFAVLLRHLNSGDDMAMIVPPILERLQLPFTYLGHSLDCRASVGAASYPDQGTTPDELMKNADLALYAAKLTHRGSVTMFAPNMRSEMQNRLSMLNLARDAIREGLILPFYQPKVCLSTGRLAGFEALLRWRHASLGVQMPASIAEAFGDVELAIQIGGQMQDRVLGDMRRWLDRGLAFHHVAINTSAAEFRKDDFAEQLLARIARAGVPREMIEVEITERTAFLGKNSDHVVRALEVLRANHVRVALDDFGTGFSSLSHLKELPVDVLKIDQSFISDIAGTPSPDDAAIVLAVLNLGKSLKIEVVAEGIEEESQVAFLRAHGCDMGQGYLFGKAVPAAQVPALIQGRRRIAA